MIGDGVYNYAEKGQRNHASEVVPEKGKQKTPSAPVAPFRPRLSGNNLRPLGVVPLDDFLSTPLTAIQQQHTTRRPLTAHRGRHGRRTSPVLGGE